ncbi:hypothetical protein ACJX0J_007618, partial [Zea mays]
MPITEMGNLSMPSGLQRGGVGRNIGAISIRIVKLSTSHVNHNKEKIIKAWIPSPLATKWGNGKRRVTEGISVFSLETLGPLHFTTSLLKIFWNVNARPLA